MQDLKITKKTTYLEVIDTRGTVFDGAFVSRTDRNGHESSKYNMPFAVVKVVEIETERDGKTKRSKRKNAVAFAYTKAMADVIVLALNIGTPV